MPGMGCDRSPRVGCPGARSGTRAPPGDRLPVTSGFGTTLEAMMDMIVYSIQIRELMESVDAAVEAYRRGLAELKRDGRPVFAPEEEQRRRRELRARLDGAFRDAEAKLRQSFQAAEQALGETPVDPLLLLSATDLARASALKPFVEDDARRLPQEELARQARAVVERKDKSAAAAYLRELDRIIADARRRGQAYHPDLGTAADALRGLFVDQKKRADLEARRDAAGRALADLGAKHYMLRTYGPNAVRTAAAD